MGGRVFGFVLIALLAGILQSSSQTPAADSAPSARMQAAAAERAEGEQLYARYCAICHGQDREGHLTEHANSLRSHSFLHTVNRALIDYAIRYGRPHTAMAAYSEAMGGPLADNQIAALATYILRFETSHREAEPKVTGDVERGKVVYEARCQQCHGPDGAGLTAPSLNDRLFLAASSSYFIRYAVAEGREGTAMTAFKSALSPEQMDDVAVYVKSWGKAWIKPDPVHVEPTDLSIAILNPKNQPPAFRSLRDGRYVSNTALKAALDANARLVILDVRATSAWASGHLPGAVSLPYYDLAEKMADLPQDGTWIVAYCSCPVHLSDKTVDALRAKGFNNVATLEEGLAGWIARGYPLHAAVAGTTSSK